jgi:hypothetical protein
MRLSRYSPEASAAPRWHNLLYIFLALFLIYNPYVAGPSATRDLKFCHPVSNRATVGASELQHFSPADDRDNVATDMTSAIVPLASSPEVSWSALKLFSQVVSPPQQFFGSSLWFRPPPAL